MLTWQVGWDPHVSDLHLISSFSSHLNESKCSQLATSEKKPLLKSSKEAIYTSFRKWRCYTWYIAVVRETIQSRARKRGAQNRLITSGEKQINWAIYVRVGRPAQRTVCNGRMPTHKQKHTTVAVAIRSSNSDRGAQRGNKKKKHTKSIPISIHLSPQPNRHPSLARSLAAAAAAEAAAAATRGSDGRRGGAVPGGAHPHGLLVDHGLGEGGRRRRWGGVGARARTAGPFAAGGGGVHDPGARATRGSVRADAGRLPCRWFFPPLVCD